MDEFPVIFSFSTATHKCKTPLGMESGGIPDSAITANTVRGDQFKPRFGQLDHTGTNCSWAAKLPLSGNTSPYLEISLEQKSGALVTGTQFTRRLPVPFQFDFNTP